MKIAFDVKGTLDGPKGHIILSLLLYLQKQGHEVVVWSNVLTYAAEFVNKHELKCEFMSKKMRSDLDERFDWAIEDDTSQTWLDAKQFMFVDEIQTTEWCLVKMGLK